MSDTLNLTELTSDSEGKTQQSFRETSLSVLNQEVNQYRKQCEDFEIKNRDMQRDMKLSEDKNSRAQKEILELKERIKNLENQRETTKREKNEILDELIDTRKKLGRRETDIISLDEELKRLSEQLCVEINAKYSAIEKLQSVENFEIELKSKEKRFEQDRKYHLEQIEHLTNELSKRSKDILNVRFEQSGRFELIEMKLAEKVEEVRLLTEQNNERLTDNATLKKEIEVLNDQISEQRNNREILKESLQREIDSQTKLIELYKNSYEEEQNKTSELTEVIENLQTLMKKTIGDFNERERTLKVTIEELKNEIVVKDDCIASMKEGTSAIGSLNAEEISRIAIENSTPRRAAAYKFLKTGASMTEVYSKFIDVTDELTKMQEENIRLQTYIDTLVQSIEEKAPIMKKEREEYEQSLEFIRKLQEENDKLIIEKCAIKSEITEAKSATGFFERENERRKQEIQDLSRQLCYLLNYHRNKLVPDSDDDFTNLTAGGIITKKLVTFKDIEELQENNRKLLALVRELSSKKEEAESMDLNEIVKLKEDYTKISAQHQELLENYATQSDILKLTISQRDSMKHLGRGDISMESAPSAMDASYHEEQNITSTSGEVVEELRLKLTETEQRLSDVTKEFDTYRIERKENERMLNERLKEMKDDYQKVIEKSVKLTSTIESSTKKISSLQMSLDTAKTQVKVLEDKNNLLNTTITKLENTSQRFNEELLKSTEKLAYAEVMLEDLKLRNRLLTENEQKMLTEKDNLVKNYESRNLLSTNIEMIKTAIERMEVENKLKLENRLDEVIRECSALRRRLQEEQDYNRDQISGYEEKMRIAKERYDEEVALSQKLHADVQNLYAELKSKQELLDELANRSQTPTPRITELMNEDHVNKEKIRQLELAIKDYELQIETIGKQLSESKLHVEQYRNLAKTSENLFNEENLKFEESKQQFQLELDAKERVINSLKVTIQQFEDKRAQKIDESLNMDIDNNSGSVADLKDNLKCLQDELQESNNLVKQLESEIIRLQDVLQKSEENYSKEIVSRANDVAKTANLKENLLRLTNQLNEEKSKHNQAIDMLKLEKGLFVEREKLLESEREKLVEKNQELEKQNDVLHNELETLNQRFTVLSTHWNTSAMSTSGVSDLDESVSSTFSNNNSTELLKVIKYLRKEKDLAIANLNLSKETHNRLEAQLTLQTTELNDLKTLLNNKQQETEAKSILASKHADLLKKVEMLNALTDSNKALRDERNRLKQQLDELTEKCVHLETISEPLNKEIGELKDKLENLTEENNLVKSDCNRWKMRANLLIEKTSKMSPDDFKKMQNERDNLAKAITAEKEVTKRLTDELNAAKGEKVKADEKVTNLTKQFIHQTDELSNLKKEHAKCGEDLTQRIEEVKKLTKEILDLKGRELQLRQIARKYKMEWTKLRQEIENLQQTNAQLEQQQIQQQQLEQHDKELKSNHAEYSERMNQLTGQIAALESDNQKLRTEIEELRKATNDKDDRAKTVLSSAKAKIVQLTDAKDSLSRELNDAKNDLNSKNELTNRLNSIRESLEVQVQNLEKDKNATVQEKDRLVREMDALNQKYLQLQRQTGLQQSLKPSTSCGTNTEKTTDTPPTANVKPITGNHSQTSSFSNWRGNETPLASIRPIAQPRLATVQPHQSQLNLSANNSAIVAPHQQLVHTTDEIMSDFMLSSPTSSHTEYMPATSSAVTIHQRQACVMPTMIGYSSNQEDETAVSTQDNDNNDQQQTSSCSGQQQPQVVALVMPRIEQSTTSTTSSNMIIAPSTTSVSVTTTISCQQASSSTTVTTSQANNSQKRNREIELDISQDDSEIKSPQHKRTRVQQIEFSENSQGISESGIEVEYQVPTSSQRDQDDDIVIIDSNEEEEIAEELDEPDECNFDANDERELIYDHLDYQEDASMSNQENNEVEILYSGSQNEICGLSAQEAGSAVSQNAETSSREQGPQSETISSGSDDATAVSQVSSYQRNRGVQSIVRPQPAHTPLQQHSYDDGIGDDSIVPSTPTLHASRRNDSCGEAVSSPHVPSTHFPFNDSSTIVATSISRSTNESEGQVEDLSTGRSVPATPLQKSPGEQTSQQHAHEVSTENQTIESIQTPVNENQQSVKDPNLIDLNDDDDDDLIETANLAQTEFDQNLNDGDNCIATASFEGDKSHLLDDEIEEGREAEASITMPGPSTSQTQRVTRLSLRNERNTAVSKTPIIWTPENQSTAARGGNMSPVRGTYFRGQRSRRSRRPARF